MFCDLRDSTLMSEKLDPEDLRRVLRLYQDSCGTVTQKYGGYVSRYMGDGILVLFGYPEAHDDDAYRAVRAGIDIISEISSKSIDFSGVSRQLSVRIGIATGMVVAGDVIGKQETREQAIVGKTPNLASRLQSISGTNEIFVNETTYRLIKGKARVESMGLAELHGLSTPVNVYRVLGLYDPILDSGEDFSDPASLLVDRERELGYLRQRWRHATDGDGRVVLIQGEPGIGKSRLIHELKRSIGKEANNVLELRCSSYLKNSFLHPVFELFQEYDETGLPIFLEKIFAEDEVRAAEARELAKAVTGAEMVKPGPAATGTNPIELPFDAIIQLFIASSEIQPLLLIIEDFHWADPSTTRLIDLLVDQIPLERILVVISSRPTSRPSWLIRSHATQVNLDRLSPKDAETMVHALAKISPLTTSVFNAVVKKSDGVPLFIEELTKSILDEKGDKSKNDEIGFAHQDDDLAVPETLRDSLMARLDQLGEAKVIAQLGSVIGREFTYAMLSEVTNLSEDQLVTLLYRLVSSELVFQRGVGSSRRYQFKHSLIQDTAYDSLVRSTKIEFHKRIAAALKNRFPGVGRSQPELMARHYMESEQTEEAVIYWNRASERALQQSANLEALHHADEGLRCVEKLPDGQRRDELSLSLHIHRSVAIAGTKGDAVPELETIYQSAAAILNRLEDANLAFSLVREMHAFHLVRGPLTRAIELGHRMLKLAEDSSDPQKLTDSRRCLGWAYICHGELEKGQDLIRKALSLYDIGDSREHTRRDTIDPGGVGMINLAWSEWLTGNSDTAARLARDAVALSRKIDHPYTLAYALCMGAAVFQCRREPEAVLTLVEEAITVAKKRGYKYWNAWGACLWGWATAQLDSPESGIQALEAGLENYRETGATLFVPHIHCMTAELQHSAGNYAEARRHLQMAADIESKNQIYFYSAETQRLFAMVEKELGETESSVTHFKNALNVARSQKARNIELRVVLSICQSPFSSLILPDAKETLASVLSNIHEGQDDIDQQIARGLATSERS